VGTEELTYPSFTLKTFFMYIANIKNSFLLLTTALLLTIGACSKMDDIEKKFTRDGEITYLSRADSLQAHGGNGRIDISWILFSDPKISSYKVYWNNGRDSATGAVDRLAGADTVHLTLTDMAEGTYYFKVFTFDASNHSSIQSSVTGKVYGPKYAASLLPRSYRKLRRVGDALQIEWMDGGDGFAGGSVRYTDNHGKPVKVTLPDRTDTTTLTAFPSGGTFDYTSAFVPEPGAIDTFYSEASVGVPVDTVHWNQYVAIFGHLGSLLAEDASGQIFWYGTDGENGFQKTTPSLLDYPWYIFNTMLSYQDNLIGRETGSGFLYRYQVDDKGVLAPAHWRIGPAGWDAFDLLFTNDDYLYGRYPDGALWRFPLLAGGAMGAGSLVTGSYNQYDKLIVCGSFLFGRDISGSLWRIGVNTDGTTEVPVLAAEQWGMYDIISVLGDNILARDETGTLWRIPVDTTGSLGQPSAITIVYESI
jgi:hypothetical protein